MIQFDAGPMKQVLGGAHWHSKLRRTGQLLTLVALIVTATALTGPTASAETIYPPSACFNGEAGPRDIVSSANGPSLFTNVILYCGDPTKGVIHIAETHPINPDGADDANVQQCHKNIMHYGTEVRAAPGNRAYQIRRPDGGSATVVFDANENNSAYDTISMFTSDGLGNNWAACASFQG